VIRVQTSHRSRLSSGCSLEGVSFLYNGSTHGPVIREMRGESRSNGKTPLDVYDYPNWPSEPMWDSILAGYT